LVTHYSAIQLAWHHAAFTSQVDVWATAQSWAPTDTSEASKEIQKEYNETFFLS